MHYKVERDKPKMAQDQFAPLAFAPQRVPRHSRIAGLLARYALVVVIAWFGAMKFTHHESYNISRFVGHSPLMSWAYSVMSIRTFGALTGVAELATAALLALKPWSPRLSVLGGVLATLFFLGTLSFMISTPGIGEPTAGGFPVLSDNGEFLMKDIALLGLAVWTLSDSWKQPGAERMNGRMTARPQRDNRAGDVEGRRKGGLLEDGGRRALEGVVISLRTFPGSRPRPSTQQVQPTGMRDRPPNHSTGPQECFEALNGHTVTATSGRPRDKTQGFLVDRTCRSHAQCEWFGASRRCREHGRCCGLVVTPGS